MSPSSNPQASTAYRGCCAGGKMDGGTQAKDSPIWGFVTPMIPLDCVRRLFFMFE